MKSRDAELFSGVLPFVLTARAKSFRAAARSLSLTPSAISKAVTRLEAELGVRLLHRTSRAVTLTQEGEAFLHGCEAAVESVRSARERVALSQRAPRGELVVSLPPLLARLVVVPQLPALLDPNPALSLRLVLTDRFVDLAAEAIDVVVRIGAAPDSRLVGRKLRRIRWVTVAAPAYLARRGVPQSPADLREQNCLKYVLASGATQEWLFRQHNASVREQPLRVSTPTNLLADDGGAVLEAALAGLGIAQAHDYIVAAAVRDGKLVELLHDHAALGPTISLLHAPGRRTAPKVRAFALFVSDLLGTYAV